MEQAGRIVASIVSGLGCLVLPFLTFGFVIAWADYSVANRSDTWVAGVLILGTVALWVACVIVLRKLTSRPRKQG